MAMTTHLIKHGKVTDPLVTHCGLSADTLDYHDANGNFQESDFPELAHPRSAVTCKICKETTP